MSVRHQLCGFLGIPILLGDALIGVLAMSGAGPFDLEADEELLSTACACWSSTTTAAPGR